MSEEAVNRLPSYSLLRLQIPVDDPQAVEVVQSQGQLSQIELDILLREHYLEGWERTVAQACPMSACCKALLKETKTVPECVCGDPGSPMTPSCHS